MIFAAAHKNNSYVKLFMCGSFLFLDFSVLAHGSLLNVDDKK